MAEAAAANGTMIVASTAPRYAAYVDGVRREYADVSDPAFRAGRSAVLSALLDRPHLYTTASARDRWEETARANVSRELASLRDPPRLSRLRLRRRSPAA